MRNSNLFTRFSLGGIKRLIALIAMFALFSNSVYVATFTVNSTSDGGDVAQGGSLGDGICGGSGVCSFRAAIEEANALAGTDTIVASGATTTLMPGSTFTISSNTVVSSTDVNRIILDGLDAAYAALTLDSNSDGSTVKGLNIMNYDGAGGIGISIQSGANNITIGGSTTQRNIIGLWNDETTVNANGVGILNAGTNVTISGNIISGNTTGIKLIDGSKDVTISTNTIGLDGSNQDKGNSANGIEVSGTVSLNGGDGGVEGLIIGSSGAQNKISGNNSNGIHIGTNTGTISGIAVIQSNFIGTDNNGQAKGNTISGIQVGTDAAGLDLTIGTDGDGTNDSSEGNQIVSNGSNGINVVEGDDVIIAGNRVGINSLDVARGNTGTGIVVGSVSQGPNTLRIGSDNGDTTERNIVANNAAGGIDIRNATTINIVGNYIGILFDGITSAGNTGGAPLTIGASQATTINIGTGGNGSIYGNFIANSASANGAIIISNTGTGAAVKIKNAFIGVDENFSSEPNSSSGIYLTAPAHYTIGTDLDGTNDSFEYNTISNNTSNGIYVGNGALTATITGNRIGCVIPGSGQPCNVAAGNGTSGATGEKNGIKIASNSLTALTIGGSDNNQRNIIDRSGEHGISITDAGNAIAFTIRNNYIGLGSDGTTALGNTGSGISAADGGIMTIVDNIIGNNSSDAVNLTGGTSLTFTGNSVGTDTGIIVAANSGHGLVLNNSTMTNAVIGGSTAGLSNIFASATGASKNGIYIQQLASSAATVSIKGNYIGVCAVKSTGAISTSNLATCKNSGHGIEALYGDLTIGGDNSLGDAGTGTIAEGNVISGNTLMGIKLGGSNVSSAAIYGNIIGLVREGGSSTGVFNVADGNGTTGVNVTSSSVSSFILGGVGATTASSKRNVIASSGTAVGVDVLTMATTGVATIKNNFIGTDWLGTTDRGNASDGIEISPNVAGMTVNVGGTATNEGNVISGNAGDGVDLNGSNSVTVNMYKNIIGLAYGGTALLINDAIGVHLKNNSGTVTIGNAETTGRNVISGNTSYGIKVTGGNVTVRGNYIGTDASGVGSGTFDNGTNEIYAESTSGSISALRIGSSNRINDLAHVGVYLKDITTWNETNSYLETDNEWSSRINAVAPTYNYWQRYAGGTLATYGPQACYDYVDNDSDGLTDYPSDTGCENVRDSDETNTPTGGGIVIGLGSGGASTGAGTTTATTTPTATTTTTDTSTTTTTDTATTDTTTDTATTDTATDTATTITDSADSEPTERPSEPSTTDRSLIEDQNIRKYIVTEKLAEAVNTTTDALTSKERVNLKILLIDTTKVVEKVDESPVVLTQDQRVIAEAIEDIANGQELSKQQIEKVERTFEAVISQSVQQILEKKVDTETGGGGGGGGAIIVPVRAANGKLRNIDKDTKLEFTLDGKKASDLQEIADARAENRVYLTSYTQIGESSVSAMLEISEGAKEVGDPNAAEKIFYGGLKGLAADSLENLKTKINKLTITNLLEGVEIAPRSVIYVVGPNPGEEVTVFVIDKADSIDPNNWKIYQIGTYKTDETGKAAVEVDFTDKMAGDFKNFNLLVQNKDGEGSMQEIMVNKFVEAKMDYVMLRNGGEVVPADLTDDGSFAKNLKTSILLAAETAKQEKNQDEKMVLTGYAEPGTVVFISWESVLLSSAVIADASQGYFEVDVPKKLAKGEHKILTYSYNKPKKTASNYSKILFRKTF